VCESDRFGHYCGYNVKTSTVKVRDYGLVIGTRLRYVSCIGLVSWMFQVLSIQVLTGNQRC